MSNFELSILGPGLLAGLLVLATHIPLGQEVLKRGIIFIDLAIAQVAGLGVIAADTMGWEPHGWMVQVVAVSSALIVALIMSWMGKHWPKQQEALIGVSFVMAATTGVLLLAGNPHGGEHLKELLVGQILWVTTAELAPTALIYAICLAFWFGLRSRMHGLGFYVVFAVAVTVSVQLVGVYLVFASLIVPALATNRLLGQGVRFAWGYAIGAGGYLIGLTASVIWDLPPGPIIVWALVVLAIAVGWIAPGFTASEPQRDAHSNP